MKRIAIGMTLLLALALATGCAAPAAQQNTDNAALQAELDAVNEEMAALQAELEALKESAGAAAPAQPEAPAEPARAGTDSAPVEAPAAQADPTPIPVANTDAPPPDYTKTKADYDLEGLAAETAAAVRQAEGAERRSTREDNYALYREIDRVLEAMEEELDRAEDQAERDYRDGLLSRSDYVEIDREIESLENDLDRAEDSLEYRLGVDD